ncbi:uncharacterized protein ISCGN_012537 [Ixodes scapularis]
MKMQSTKKKNSEATSDLTLNNEEREKRKRKRLQHTLSSFEDEDFYDQDERRNTQPAPQLPERAPEPKQKRTRELCAPALNRRQKTMSQPSSCRKPTPNGLLLNRSGMHQLGPRKWSSVPLLRSD